MRAVVVVGVIAAALASLIPENVEARDRLVVRRAVVLADRGLIRLDLRCDATRDRCAGTLRAGTFYGDAISASRQVRLAVGRPRRVLLRLRADGLRRLAAVGGELSSEVTLTDTARRAMSADVLVHAQISCRSGNTLAASEDVRVLRVLAFGVYACSRPAGTPVFLAHEEQSLAPAGVDMVKIAGRFVAFSTFGAWKCSGWAVHVFDLGARRIVRRRVSQTMVDSLANGCFSSTAITALVVRPSGAVAWIEAAGDAGVLAVRAVDDTGDRTLDTGANVDATSLRLAGTDAVSWLSGNLTRTAPLR